MKKVSNPNKFYTEMISEKNWTISEIFNEFGDGTRIDWWNPVDLPIHR